MAVVILQSCDGVTHTVSTEVATLSSLVHDVIEHCATEENMTIPLLKVPDAALSSVVEWMRRKQQATSQATSSTCDCRLFNPSEYDEKDSDLSNWERLYFDSLDKDVLIMMLNAANYMGINALIASGSSYVAEIISGLTLDEARTYLNESVSSETNKEDFVYEYPWDTFW